MRCLYEEKRDSLLSKNLEILLKGVYLNIFEGKKRTRPKRGESKKKSKKKSEYVFLERIKTGT